MASRLALAVVGAFAVSLFVVGAGQAAVCDPHCSPQSNKPSQSTNGLQERGTDHAITKANQNGIDNGLNTARQQPGNYKTPVAPSGGDTGGGDTGGSTGGDTGGGGTPCTAC